MAHDEEEVTRLGLWGLAPFAVAAVAVWLSPIIIPQWIALNLHSLALAYGGVIAAWLAGAGAGAALRGGGAGPYLPGMIAALVAWFVIWPSGFLTLSVPAVWRYLILIVLFSWLLMRDLAAVAAGQYPEWYGRLRTRLTFWACVFMIIIMSRLITWAYY